MDRSWESRRTWRQSRSRERERRGRSPSSSRLGSRTSTNEIGLGVLNVENMMTLQMNVLI